MRLQTVSSKSVMDAPGPNNEVERRSPLVWWLAGLAWGLAGATVILLVLNRDTIVGRPGLPIWATVGQSEGTALAAILATAVLGGLVLTRRPGNRMGQVFLGASLILAVSVFAQEYAVRGLVTAPGSLPWPSVMAWIQVVGNKSILLAMALVLLLFPRGSLLSSAWRPALWVALLATVLQILHSIDPFPVTTGFRAGNSNIPATMPPALWVLGRLADRWGRSAVSYGPALAILLSGAAVVARFRAARGEERQQVKWLAFAGALVGVGYAASLILQAALDAHYSRTVDVAQAYIDVGWSMAAAIGLPLAAGIAILRHRLYDIDLVINKALVYGSLAVVITLVYVATVVGVGALFGQGDRPNVALSILAAAVTAVAFQPARERLQRVANRLVYGHRANPYEILSRFADRVAGTYAADEVMPRMARVLADGTGATATVWLKVGDELRPAATWPTTDAPLDPVPAGDGALPSLVASRAVPVRHQGELLGALTVTKPPGTPLSGEEVRLLEDLASQAGLVLRNVRLIEELKASRQRLVWAQDQERRRLERDLHDGAQQRLVTMSLALRMARDRAATLDGELAAEIEETESELRRSLAELRELARGIHPAVLTEGGLSAALSSLAERSAVPATVLRAPDGRFAPAVEATAYFMVSEALANVAKHARATSATIAAEEANGRLVVEVVDDGVGGASSDGGSGLRGLVDRVAAVDGQLRLESTAGGGTRVTAEIPCVSS
jgi:signal transduction histidine kinase